MTGLDTDLSGHLTIRPGLEPWKATCTLSNIRVQGRDYDLREGRLIPQNFAGPVRQRGRLAIK